MINQILFKRIDKKFGSALQSVWDESHHQNLGPELRGRNIGVNIWILLIIYMESPY